MFLLINLAAYAICHTIKVEFRLLGDRYLNFKLLNLKSSTLISKIYTDALLTNIDVVTLLNSADGDRRK